MTIITYIVAIIGSNIAWQIATFISYVVISVFFLWMPELQRAKIVGFLVGIVSVVFAVFIGSLIFSWLSGPNSFSAGAYFACTVPIAFTIPSELTKARNANLARRGWHTKLASTFSQDELNIMADMTQSTHRRAALGTLMGLLVTGLSQFMN